MDKVKKSVLVPIIFFSWFGFPLTLRELRRYLWRHELEEKHLGTILETLPGVKRRGGLVWLGETTWDRAGREKLAERLWVKVARWRWIFANVPFLRGVFVSNTLSYNNARTGSDVDLFLITASKRVWTTRAWLLVWMNLFNLRVRSVDRASKFSPEFFITEDNLDIKSVAINNDYYLSFWLADLVPIWPGDEISSFRQANRWYASDLPIAWRSLRTKNYSQQSLSWYARALEWVLGSGLGDRLEVWFRRRQEQIIKRTLSKLGVNPQVITDERMIKLHFNDRRAGVRDEIEAKLHEILGED